MDQQAQGAAELSATGLPADTQVLTPTGWRVVEDLRAGELVVDGEGRACRVAAVRTGYGPVLGLRLADGSTVAAGRGQAWQVEVGAQRVRRALNSDQIEQHLARRTVVRMANSGAVVMPGLTELPLDGHLLGLLLGDGGLSSLDSVVLWTSEDELKRRAEAALPIGARFSEHPLRQARCTGWGITGISPCRGGNPVLNALRQLGLSGVKSFEKHVPLAYRWAPIPDRLAVLNGLLDSDGGITPQGQISFSSASPQLSDDVVFLVRSLGGRCSASTRQNVTYTVPSLAVVRSARDSHRVTGIRLPGFAPFRLTRKADRVRPAIRTSQWTVRSIRNVGVQRLISLEVDGPTGSFLAADFLPVLSYTSTGSWTAGRQAA